MASTVLTLAFVVSFAIWASSSVLAPMVAYKTAASGALFVSMIGLQVVGMFSASGAFEVIVNGKKVHSKLETGEYPEVAGVVEAVGRVEDSMRDGKAQ